MEVELTTFDTPGAARQALEALGIEPEGAKRLAMKAIMRPILIHGVRGGGANLLKQEMLARGGDAAVPRISVMHPDQLVDICLIGTPRTYKSLIRYLTRMPIFQFPSLAEQIQGLLGGELDDDLEPRS